MPIPGLNMMTQGSAGAAASAFGMSFVAGTTDTGGSGCTLMASIVAGDLLIIQSFAEDTGGTVADVTPSGWTKLTTIAHSGSRQTGSTRGGSPIYTSFGVRMSVFYKIADGTESSSTITCLSGDDEGHHVAQYRPDSGSITSVTLQDDESEGFAGGGSIPGAKIANAGNSGKTTITLQCYGHNDTPALTHSETMDYDGLNGDGENWGGFLLQDPATAVDVTATPGDTSNGTAESVAFISCYMEID